MRTHSLGVFGSTVQRFTEKPIGTRLGPGQYKPRLVGRSHNSALAVAGSAAFKAQLRPGMIDAEKSFNMPAPGDYGK